jgi:hypothetical protein
VLAAGTSFVSASSGCANASGTVTCTSSGLTAGSNETWTITAHISSGYADGGDLANTASIDTSADRRLGARQQQLHLAHDRPTARPTSPT